MDKKRRRWYDFIERLGDILEDLRDSLQESSDPHEGDIYPPWKRRYRSPFHHIDQSLFKEREPIIEVYRDKDSEITLIGDVPGIKEEDVKIDLIDEVLEVRIYFNKRWYRKRIPLPRPVKEVETRYNNGILQVRVRLEGCGDKSPGLKDPPRMGGV